MPAPKLTNASVKNALAAATAVGLTPSAMVIQPDGSMRIEFDTEQLEDVSKSKTDAKAPKRWGEKRVQ
jgi:hypothetical protein